MKTGYSLYRKYRPANWSEVCGQEVAVSILRSTVKNRDISHAYLFCGPRGTGKTSMARIFAKALNCLNPQEGEPCLVCEACLSFSRGSYPDFIEMDAASNRKIDDFREISNQVRYAPMAGKDKFKVYVIDEAHMLTKEAANAFLKTLEEPPPYVIFLLATTEADKLLPTIQSRCMRLDLNLLNYDQIRERVLWVAGEEGFTIEEPVIEKLISHGEGGLRDVFTLLERTIHYCGKEINLSGYLEMMGFASVEEMDFLLEGYFNRESSGLLQNYRQLIAKGRRPQDLILQILERVRDYIFFVCEITGRYAPVPQWAVSPGVVYWRSVYEHFLQVLDGMQHSFHPLFHGELGLLAFVEKNETGRGNVSQEQNKDLVVLETKLKELEDKIAALPVTTQRREAARNDVVRFKEQTAVVSDDNERSWLSLKKEMKENNVILHALIEFARFEETEKGVRLVFAKDYAVHYRRFREEKQFGDFVRIIRKRYGSEAEIEVLLLSEDGSEKSFRPESPSTATSGSFAPGAAGRGELPEELKDKLLEEDGLKRLVEELGAEIKSVS
jgi:DNA polymerase III subunit gamma/tau